MYSHCPKGMITTEWDKPQHIVVVVAPRVYVRLKGLIQMVSIS